MLQLTFALFVLGVPFLRWRRARKACTGQAWAFVKAAEEHWDKLRCPGCGSIDVGFLETKMKSSEVYSGRIRKDGGRDGRYTASTSDVSWYEDLFQCRKCLRKFGQDRSSYSLGQPEDPKWHPSGFASPRIQDGKEAPDRSGRTAYMKLVRKDYWAQAKQRRRLRQDPWLFGGAVKGAFLWVIAAVVWAVVMK